MQEGVTWGNPVSWKEGQDKKISGIGSESKGSVDMKDWTLFFAGKTEAAREF